jgi:lysophospholipase L1-like esterase
MLHAMIVGPIFTVEGAMDASWFWFPGVAIIGSLSMGFLGGVGRSVAGVPRWLALGDSYTIGEGVAAAERWPAQVAAHLRERGMALADPVIVARTGWTTDELLAGIEQTGPTGTFALVSLLIGVNNQFRGRDVEEYRGQFVTLLKRAIAFAGGDARRVIVLSIPDWGATPYAEGRDRGRIAAEIDRFNEVNREETARAGARYVDVTRESRRVDPARGRIAPDGLHPSGAMYASWTRLVLPEALAALGAGGS